MAIAFVQSTTKKLGANGGTTNAADFTGATSFYLWVTYDTGGPVINTNITESVGSTNPIALTARTPASSGAGRLFYYENVTGGNAMTFTVTKNSSFSAIMVIGFSGAATSSSFSAESGNTDDNVVTTVTPAGALTCAATDLVVFGLASSTNVAAPTYPAGYTGSFYLGFTGGSNYSTSLCYNLSPSASEQPTYTFASMNHVACGIASFIQASGGATRPVKMAGEWGGYAGTSGGFAG